MDPTKIEAIVEASKESLQSGHANPRTASVPLDYEVPALAPETSIDQFTPIDVRVGKVIACEPVEGSNKLLRLSVDLGPLGRRTIFSGIALSYAPERLVGRHVAVYANLKPRKMRFGISEGMILAAGEDDASITVVELAATSRPGERIT
jgi:methionyl-tRNA synthetase